MRRAIGRRLERFGVAVGSRLGPRAGALFGRVAGPIVGGIGGRPARRRLLLELRLAKAKAAREAGQWDLARNLGEDLLSEHADDQRVLRLRREIAQHDGDVTEQVRIYHRLHQLDPTEARRTRERRALGRLVETTPGWLPRIPGPPCPVVTTGDGIALHLLKESVPELTNGFTMRSHYNLVAARAAGVQPVVVTSLGFPRLLGHEAVEQVETIDGIPHHRLDLGPFYSLAQPFDALLEDQAWLTANVARRVAPAILHVSSGHRGYETALVGLAVRDHIRRPLVYEVRSFFEATWSADPDSEAGGEYFARRFATETRSMLAADHVITISEAMRRNIIERGVPAERVSILPNGVDAEAFAPIAPDPELRRRYQLDGRFVFGYVSNLDHWRENQELLIEATWLLLRRGRQVACLIVGDGRRREELERLAQARGVAGSVVFTGQVPHARVRDHYALMDAFVVPRRDEWASRAVTPLKPFEAMAMARPLVVADLPALTEIAEPEVRSLAFPPNDAAALASTLERLIDDRALGRRLGEAGRAWVARERTWTANGPRVREVYQETIARWSRAAGAA